MQVWWRLSRSLQLNSLKMIPCIQEAEVKGGRPTARVSLLLPQPQDTKCQGEKGGTNHLIQV